MMQGQTYALDTGRSGPDVRPGTFRDFSSFPFRILDGRWHGHRLPDDETAVQRPVPQLRCQDALA